jgi:hypothetical protein
VLKLQTTNCFSSDARREQEEPLEENEEPGNAVVASADEWKIEVNPLKLHGISFPISFNPIAAA